MYMGNTIEPTLPKTNSMGCASSEELEKRECFHDVVCESNTSFWCATDDVSMKTSTR